MPHGVIDLYAPSKLGAFFWLGGKKTVDRLYACSNSYSSKRSDDDLLFAIRRASGTPGMMFCLSSSFSESQRIFPMGDSATTVPFGFVPRNT